ncbi:MAG: DUF4340 domain-containing protein [Saprospiraceae bacterium]
MMSNRKLLYLFLGLLLIFAITQLFNTKKDRSFKSELLKVDTSLVNKIVIHSTADNHKETILTKSRTSDWTATQNQKTVPVVPGTLDGILNELPFMKIKSIATQSKEKYNEYEIGDSAASHIEVFAGSKKVADFYSGKFGFNAQTNSMISYIRLKDDSNVYATDGFQSMTFNAPFSSFRDKNILKVSADQIQKISAISNTNKLDLVKSGTTWSLNGVPLIDSTAIQNYLNSIQSLSGQDLIDDYSKPGSPSHSAIVDAAGIAITVDLYPSGDTLKPFMIHSSANADVYFKEDSSNTFKTIFGGITNLIPSSPVKKK